MTEIDRVKTFKAELTRELHIDLRKNPVGVRLDGKSLVIEGVVEGIALKKKALLLAMSLTGVEGVVDRLKVRPSAGMTDGEIKAHLDAAISQEPALAGLDINAEINGGVVDIEGTVGSLSHKRLAGAIAWWIPGVADVINSLEVSPDEEDTDDEVADAVRLVHEKDGLVHSSSIGVRAKDWVVTLDGVALSESEKNAAEEDAWYVWGVNGVKNNIKVTQGAGRAAAERAPALSRPYRPHRLPLRKTP